MLPTGVIFDFSHILWSSISLGRLTISIEEFEEHEDYLRSGIDLFNRISAYFLVSVIDFLFLVNSIQYSRIWIFNVKAIKPQTFDEPGVRIWVLNYIAIVIKTLSLIYSAYKLLSLLLSNLLFIYVLCLGVEIICLCLMSYGNCHLTFDY